MNPQTLSPLPFALGSAAIIVFGFLIAIATIISAGPEWGAPIIHSIWIVFAAACLGVLSGTISLIVRLTWYGGLIWIGAVGVLVWISVFAFAIWK